MVPSCFGLGQVEMLIGMKAAAGGVLRDENGAFLIAFVVDLGGGNVLDAELKAIQTGVSLVQHRGMNIVLFESDSLLAVKLMRDGCSSLHPSHSLVADIQNRLKSLREYCFAHTHREVNQVADGLAKFGLNLDTCCRIFTSLLHFLSLLFHVDLTGIMFPRGF